MRKSTLTASCIGAFLGGMLSIAGWQYYNWQFWFTILVNAILLGIYGKQKERGE